MPDNYIQDPFNTQNFNRYGYCLNNPLKYTDPNGEIIWAAVIVGAIIGAYTGGTIANNGEANPIKWNYSVDTFAHILSGAVIGALSGYVGGAIATSQIPMANTLGIAGGSIINSLGTYVYTEGKTDISISFGAASYNFTQGSFGYLGKKGNSFLENVGYGLGAMANLADLGETGKLLLNTEKKDIINHSAILDENGNVIISEGPGKNWIEPKGSVDHYLNRTLGGSGATNRYPVLGENVTINKVNLTAIKTYGKVLDFLTKNGDRILPYSFVYSSCSTHTGLALNLAGIPTLFIHPYTVQGSVWLWNKGITPSIINNSYHLQNQRKWNISSILYLWVYSHSLVFQIEEEKNVKLEGFWVLKKIIIFTIFNHCISQEERKALALKEIKLIYASSLKNDNVIHIEEYLGKMYNEYKYEIKVKWKKYF